MARPVAAPSPVLPGSFRDPSGFVFRREGTLCRQVNVCYREAYEHLMGSGLYRSLTAAGLLIPHEEVPMEPPRPGIALMVIRPDMAPFVSYPYEWCFSELKDAALALLRIQKMSLDFGMSLKDCSAYNVQFVAGRPVLIDTLSFEKYREGQPWVAYRQFCQHFLAPLALMSHRDVRLGQLLRVYIDGVPLDLASSLLPFRTRLTFSLLSHIHLHARSQKHFARATGKVRDFNLGLVSFRGLIDSLESATNRLEWRPDGTQWADYYKETSYSPEAFEHKRHVVAAFIERTQPASLWDLGANTGEFSRLAGDRGIPTISFDLDPAAVEKNYLQCQKGNGGNVLPLVLDLSNPSPAIGWENEERMSLVERGPADAVMALALAHHLAIANNVPLDRVARFLSRICRWLIIEFVPKSDPQVQRMLATREDIFSDYNQAGFESGFREYFVIEDWARITGSDRVIYLMRGSR